MEKQYSQEYMVERLYKNIYNTIQSDKKNHFTKPTVAYLNRDTIVTNFTEVCHNINREKNDILQYFHAELSPNISIGGDGQMIIKKRHAHSQIELLFKNYILQYVRCKVCKSGHTHIEKEERIKYVVCEHCNSKVAV